MSRVSRRAVLRGGAVATAALAAPAGALIERRATLAVFDSGIAESRAFAAGAPLARRLDLAAEHRRRFGTLRAGLAGHRSIEGLTRWTDWVALRSELEVQGFRVSSEGRTGRRGELFRWTMRRA